MTEPDGRNLFGPQPIPVSTEPLFQNATAKKPRQPPRPRPRATSILEVGDVIAVGLTNGRCPIGRVKAVNDHGFRLNLYSAVAWTFTAGAAVVLWSQASEFLLACQSDGELFEMGPLAAFQTAWTKDAPRDS